MPDFNVVPIEFAEPNRSQFRQANMIVNDLDNILFRLDELDQLTQYDEAKWLVRQAKDKVLDGVRTFGPAQRSPLKNG